jgi:negative regulator of flagellin synthesis FlgM
MIDNDHFAFLFTTGEKTTMQISGNFSVAGVDATRSTSRANAITSAHAETEASLSLPVDQLDLSPEALAISNQPEQSAIGETFRADKVASLRDAIASGNYDTDEKLNAAFEIMLDRLG